MGGVVGQGDTKGAVRFHNFLFGSVQVLTCYCFFSAGPTAGPDGAGASALKLTLIYERKREAEGGDERGRGRGRGRVRGTRTWTREQVRLFCPYLCIILFLLFCFSISQVSSASSPPLPVQTGKGLPLNDFSWASPALVLLGSRL